MPQSAPVTTALTPHREVRDRRERAGLAQEAVAMRLAISRQSLISFELYGRPLPRGLTPADAIAAIEALAKEN